MEGSFQAGIWKTQFGKEYTDRNSFLPEEIDKIYEERYGISRSEMNIMFLQDLNLQDKKILEVGCNVGNNLFFLQKAGYENLYGIEVQDYAVEKAKELTKGINIIQGLADDIPFKNKWFDMVFTSGVLIHISPGNVGSVLDEIYRCTREYIWGFEYYADEYTEIHYRGYDNLLWKTNFAKLYTDRFSDLRLVKEKRFKYNDSENVDTMFLLKKDQMILTE